MMMLVDSESMHIPEDKQTLNKNQALELTNFIVSMSSKPMSEAWVKEVWVFLHSYPLPSLVYDRIENFWNPLRYYSVRHNQVAAMLDFLNQFKKFLSLYKVEDRYFKMDKFRADLNQIKKV